MNFPFLIKQDIESDDGSLDQQHGSYWVITSTPPHPFYFLPNAQMIEEQNAYVVRMENVPTAHRQPTNTNGSHYLLSSQPTGMTCTMQCVMGRMAFYSNERKTTLSNERNWRTTTTTLGSM